jgi:hypothetical protein
VRSGYAAAIRKKQRDAPRGVGSAEHDHQRGGDGNDTNVYSAAVREQLGQRRIVCFAQQVPIVPPRHDGRHDGQHEHQHRGAKQLTAE